MSDDFKDFSTTPTLTFDVTPEPEELPAVDTDTDLTAVNEDPAFDESRLSPEELKMVEDFSAKIDLHNSQAILQYGVGTQKKMADFSESALKVNVISLIMFIFPPLRNFGHNFIEPCHFKNFFCVR